MNAADVCSFSEDGRHRYSGYPWRLPVGWKVQATARDDPSKPTPLRYWEIDQCRRCGHEKETPHGFMPGRSQGSGRGDA
jgi:hypothetical protein